MTSTTVPEKDSAAAAFTSPSRSASERKAYFMNLLWFISSYGQNTRTPQIVVLAIMIGRMNNDNWARLLSYVTGPINEQLLLQNEYLAAENRILRAHLPTRLRLSDPQR